MTRETTLADDVRALVALEREADSRPWLKTAWSEPGVPHYAEFGYARNVILAVAAVHLAPRMATALGEAVELIRRLERAMRGKGNDVDGDHWLDDAQSWLSRHGYDHAPGTREEPLVCAYCRRQITVGAAVQAGPEFDEMSSYHPERERSESDG